LVRLVLLQTKEDLLSQLALLTQMPVQGVEVMAGLQPSEAPEDIACELLDGLNSLPVECVATNGPSLVQKGESSSGIKVRKARTDGSALCRHTVDGVLDGPVTNDCESVSQAMLSRWNKLSG
jgi:hypothetical protein